MRRDLALPAMLLLALSSPVFAAASQDSKLCQRAVVAAEFGARVPARLLEAISKVESGRPDEAGRLKAWPWTINAEGEGHFYATKAQAIAAVREFQGRGVQSIDVGCMQVNLFHHPRAFASLDRAFDPYENARYAGQFLNELYLQLRSWTQATAAYHSQTPALAEPYQRRVMEQWQRPSAEPAGSSKFTAFATAGAAYRSFVPAETAFAAFPKVR